MVFVGILLVGPSILLVGKLQHHPAVCFLVLSSRCSYLLCLYFHPSFCCSSSQID